MPHSRPRRAGEMWTCPPHSTSAFERPSDRKSCSGPGLADACARHRHLSREAFSDGSSATSDAGRARSDGPVTAVTVSDHSSGSQPWQCQAQIRSVIVVAITIVVIWQERMGPNYAGPWRRRRGPWAHAQPPTPDTHTPARSKPYWNLVSRTVAKSRQKSKGLVVPDVAASTLDQPSRTPATVHEATTCAHTYERYDRTPIRSEVLGRVRSFGRTTLFRTVVRTKDIESRWHADEHRFVGKTFSSTLASERGSC